MKKILIVFLLGCFHQTSQAQPLKLLSYNIRLSIASDGENIWDKRKDYWASQLRFYEPDIFGVQEATPLQVIDIAIALPGYSYIGTGREGVGRGESSNIYYKTNRFLLKDSGTFWLSETPEEVSIGWDAAYNRVCSYALFKDRKTSKKFWVFNTHLDHVGEVARTKGLELIERKIKAFNSKKYPVFLMGDFNTEPTEERIINLKKLMDDSRDLSVEKPFGPSGSFNNFEHNKAVTRLIDYIFISKNSGITVNKYAILSDSKDLRYPSDHLPIYIEVIF